MLPFIVGKLRYAQCSVFVNIVVTPEHCSLFTLPPDELQCIVSSMEEQASRIVPRLRINRKVWDGQIRYLRTNSSGRQSGLTQIRDAILDSQPNEESVQFSLARGWRLADAGKLSEALKVASQVQSNSPLYYQSLELCGHVHLLRRELQQAEHYLNRAVELSRRPYSALRTRAWLRHAQQRTAEGIEDALRSLALCGSNSNEEAEAWWVLGALYLQAQDFRARCRRTSASWSGSPLSRARTSHRPSYLRRWDCTQMPFGKSMRRYALDSGHADALAVSARLGTANREA